MVKRKDKGADSVTDPATSEDLGPRDPIFQSIEAKTFGANGPGEILTPEEFQAIKAEATKEVHPKTNIVSKVVEGDLRSQDLNAIKFTWRDDPHLGTTQFEQSYGGYRASGFCDDSFNVKVSSDICYTFLTIEQSSDYADQKDRPQHRVRMMLGKYELRRLIYVMQNALDHMNDMGKAWGSNGKKYCDGDRSFIPREWGEVVKFDKDESGCPPHRCFERRVMPKARDDNGYEE